MEPTLPPAIAHAIASGATLLTANQRAARTLRRAFETNQTAQCAAGRALWEPPQILAIETWLEARWTALILSGYETRALLNRTQEHSLWLAILSADLQAQAGDALTSPDTLADLAARAWRLLHLYLGSARLPELTQTTDTRAFLRWSREFDRRLIRAAQITSAQLPQMLTQALAEGELDLSDAGLTLVDFDHLPPALNRLISAIEQAGYPVQRLQTTADDPTASLYAAEDDSSEIRAAATWIRDLLAQDPAVRIALVVPDLAPRRAELDRIFHQVLAPNQAHIAAAAEPLPYEFSLGEPLAKTALIASALQLLRWIAEPLSLPAISALLLSPFFGGVAGPLAESSLDAADFDAHVLRRLPLLRPELSLEALLGLLKKKQALPGLQARLQAMRRVSAAEQLTPVTPGAEGPRQGYAGWTDSFRALLEAAGWARAAASSGSLAFQAHRRWENALDEVATLDFESVQVTAAQALTALTRIARETIFAPESSNANVQILGPLELGGIPFDALWFLGADDLAWPVASSPQPLLPFALQRALSTPGADARADAAQAEALTRRLTVCASTVIFSYASLSEEGERRPSPLVAHLPRYTPKPAAAALEPQPLDRFLDNLPLPPIEGLVHGGARVLELQAACGFRAFAELRLHSTAPQDRAFGLDPRDRGDIVHRTMEDLWHTLGNQIRLRALAPDDRLAALTAAIESGMGRAAALASSPWDLSYLDVQRARLKALLLPWLELEMARPEFEVTSQERALKAQPIGPLLLDLRVDRIDETAAGLVILDYKTGAANPTNWLSERPEAPQLPLYATVLENVAGVAFAQLQAGRDLCLKGFADSPDALMKPSRMDAVSLPEQIESWREILTALAEAFASGDARVLPKSYPRTCAYCDQRILCRLDPTSLEHFDDDDSTPAEVQHG